MVSKDNAEHYFWGEQCEGWHLLKRHDLSIIYEQMPPAKHEIRHYHVQSRQFFFVLEGQFSIEVEGVLHHLHVHQGIEVPPGAKHQARNISDNSVTFLVISHPTTRGDRNDVV